MPESLPKHDIEWLRCINRANGKHLRLYPWLVSPAHRMDVQGEDHMDSMASRPSGQASNIRGEDLIRYVQLDYCKMGEDFIGGIMKCPSTFRH